MGLIMMESFVMWYLSNQKYPYTSNKGMKDTASATLKICPSRIHGEIKK